MPPSLAELSKRFLQTCSATATVSVEPYDVTSAFRVDSQVAWNESQVVLKCLGVSTLPQKPAEWSNHVQQQPQVRYLPMAAGHFPQMVSDLDSLLGSSSVAAVNNVVTVPAASPAYAINQSATAFWKEGRYQEARKLWQTLPDSAVKSFNLGLVALVNGELSNAAPQLQAAAKALPANSGWAALAELYTTLAEGEL